MMERLTKRIEGGQAVFHECHGTCGTCDGTTCYCIGPMVDRLAAYEDTGLSPEEIIELKNLMQGGEYKPSQEWLHVQELIQAEQEGRLVVLPAKTVFELTWDAGPDCDMICPVVIDGNECCDFCDKGKLFVYERNCKQDLMNMLGKTVFLTREEAEAALEAQKGGDEG